jgi:hypothetical protein
MPASSTATVIRMGPPVTVKLFDGPNNFGVYALSYHEVTTGGLLATLATNVNSHDPAPPGNQPNTYALPRTAATTPGTVAVCLVTIVPIGTAGPIQFSIQAFQGDQRIDDNLGKLLINSAAPTNEAIRMVFA